MNEKRVKLLQKFIEEEPSNPFNKYALAMEYYDISPDKSLAILGELLSMHKTYLPTYFKAAHLLWESEKWNEAERVFKDGIELAQTQGDQKALHELKAAYQNFEFDRD